MKSTVIVSTQFYENYNVSADGFNTNGDGKPSWKPKMGHEFTIEMDSDLLMYCDNIEEIFSHMVSKHNSEAEKFEYRSHEIKFSEPTKLGTQEEFLKINEIVNN